MRRLPWIGLLLGVGILTALVAWQGLSTVDRLFREAGWPLLVLVPLFLGWSLPAASLSWRALIPASRGERPGRGDGPRSGVASTHEPPPARPDLAGLVWATWTGTAINWLLPVAQVGGDVARARYVSRRGTPLASAVASVVVDKTVQVAVLAATAAAGAAFLVAARVDGGVAEAGAAGAALLALAGLAFYRAQRRGLFATVSRAIEWLGGGGAWVERAERVDEAIARVWRAPVLLARATIWRIVFRLGMAAEIWIALALLGHRATVLDALTLEFLGQAVRAAAFLVPAGLGVQEGGFMALAAALGYPPSAGLALSLARRVRELGVGLPGLLAWQVAEGRRAAGTR